MPHSPPRHSTPRAIPPKGIALLVRGGGFGVRRTCHITRQVRAKKMLVSRSYVPGQLVAPNDRTTDSASGGRVARSTARGDHRQARSGAAARHHPGNHFAPARRRCDRRQEARRVARLRVCARQRAGRDPHRERGSPAVEIRPRRDGFNADFPLYRQRVTPAKAARRHRQACASARSASGQQHQAAAHTRLCGHS
jgi:hypothetical protein